jgi:hypothetical protein
VSCVKKDGERLKTEDVAEDIIHALEKGDKVAFKDLFAANLKLSETLDTQVDAIFGKFSGEVVSFEGVELSNRESTDRIAGRHIVQQTYNYNVWLVDSFYNFYITVQIYNRQKPEEKGVQRIVFRKEKNETTDEILIASETELLK